MFGMNLAVAFLADLAFVVLACVGIVAYLSKHLRVLLIELCGTVGTSEFLAGFLECCAGSCTIDFCDELQTGIGIGGKHRV
jgi:hypothetical protein